MVTDPSINHLCKIKTSTRTIGYSWINPIFMVFSDYGPDNSFTW